MLHSFSLWKNTILTIKKAQKGAFRDVDKIFLPLEFKREKGIQFLFPVLVILDLKKKKKDTRLKSLHPCKNYQF